MAIQIPDPNAMVNPSWLLGTVAGQLSILQTLWAKILSGNIVIASPIACKYQEHKYLYGLLFAVYKTKRASKHKWKLIAQLPFSWVGLKKTNKTKQTPSKKDKTTNIFFSLLFCIAFLLASYPSRTNTKDLKPFISNPC